MDFVSFAEGAQRPLPADPESRRDLETLEREGYLVIPELLDADHVASLRAELAPHLEGDHWGRTDFEGFATERVYSLLAKCPSVAPLVEHPRVLAALDHYLRPSRLLAACQANCIHPGETAQLLHCDDDLGAPPRPREPLSVSVMWSLDPYTEENGGTCIVPRSHTWKEFRQPANDEAISVAMPPGSALLYLGGVFHGGGHNRSDTTRLGISIIYFQPWLRQVENMTLAIPPEVAANYSEQIQRMLGYSVIDGLFFGHVDARDPIKLVRAAAKPGSGESD